MERKILEYYYFSKKYTMQTQKLRIALVADWLIDFWGAELVLSQLLDMFPEADIYTSVCFMKHPMLEGRHIYTSWIQKIPFLNRRHKLAGILRPWAFRSFDLSGYDLIICSSSAESKEVAMGKWNRKKNPPHPLMKSITNLQSPITLCYCHTPIRYYWSHYEEYRNMMEFGWINPLARWILPKVVHWMKKLDYEASQKVDYFIANSQTTQERIKKYYDRESEVIYPGVDIAPLQQQEIDGVHEVFDSEKHYYISVWRCIPYKRFDLLVDAFNANGKNLILCTATDTPLFRELKAESRPNIEWKFGISNEEKNRLIAGAKAFLFPPEEDFGIVPTEAMALGVPVIAYGKWGATESVIEWETGIFFTPQTPTALSEAIERFETMTFDRAKILEQAKTFSKEVFQKKIYSFFKKHFSYEP